jgi:hypothetical protein
MINAKLHISGVVRKGALPVADVCKRIDGRRAERGAFVCVVTRTSLRASMVEKKSEQVRPDGDKTGEAGQGRTRADEERLKSAPFDGHNSRNYRLPMSACVRIFPLVGRRPRRRPEGTP